MSAEMLPDETLIFAVPAPQLPREDQAIGEGQVIEIGQVQRPPILRVAKQEVNTGSCATPEEQRQQREEALNKANQTRVDRSEFKADIKTGEVPPSRIFDDPRGMGMEIAMALSQVPRLGPVKLKKALVKAHVAATSELGALDESEKSVLKDLLPDHRHLPLPPRRQKTPAQKKQAREALAQANPTRLRQSELKHKLKMNEINFVELMDDEAMKRAKLGKMLGFIAFRSDILGSKPANNAAKLAQQIVDATNLPPDLRLGAMTPRQREVLIGELATRGHI